VTQATTIVFKVDDAAAAGLDRVLLSGTLTGTITITEGYTTCDTMGELVDVINSSVAWRAYLVAAIRSDPVSLLITTTSSAAAGANGLTIYCDTSANTGAGGSIGPGVAISGEKFVSNGINGHVKDWEDQCENSTFSTSTGTLVYYSGKAGSAETQIGSDVPLTTAVRKEQGEANLSVPFIKSTLGHRLVVRCESPSIFAVAAGCTDFQVIGTTAVFANDRIVNEDNY
jgi:hypothetical protein